MKVLAARTVHSLLLSEIPLGYAARRHDDALQAISPRTEVTSPRFRMLFTRRRNAFHVVIGSRALPRLCSFLGLYCTQFQRGEEYTQVVAPVGLPRVQCSWMSLPQEQRTAADLVCPVAQRSAAQHLLSYMRREQELALMIRPRGCCAQ
jgi:hypothetical protein